VNHDLDRMAELIDDELLDQIAIAGSPDEAPDRLRAWEGVADRVILGVPWYGMNAERQREAISAAMESAARVTEGRGSRPGNGARTPSADGPQGW
jgi:alkanesulfonate monooxygenase SsuD/methylene tetrahydromethanopterin reductase-like flavin-dependent oxidoreductase (luciferase family)